MSDATRNRRALAWLAPRLDVILVVAFFAVGIGIIMAISYQHEYVLALRNGQVSWVARLVPVSVDGMVIEASLALFWAGRHGIRRPFPPLATAAVGVVATIGANFVSDWRSPWLGPAVSGSAGVAAVLLGWVAMWMVETQRKLAAGEPVQRDVNCSCPAPATTLADALRQAQRALRDAGEQYGQETLARRFGTTVHTVRKALAPPVVAGASSDPQEPAPLPPLDERALANGDGRHE